MIWASKFRVEQLRRLPSIYGEAYNLSGWRLQHKRRLDASPQDRCTLSNADPSAHDPHLFAMGTQHHPAASRSYPIEHDAEAACCRTADALRRTQGFSQLLDPAVMEVSRSFQ